MIREIDLDGALLLAAAIARQWMRELPDELPMIASWLNLDPHQLRRTHRAERPGDGVTTCLYCGAYLPEYHGRRGYRGRYCNASCRKRHKRKHHERTEL